MKESSAPESMRKVRDSLSFPHYKVPGSCTYDDDGQEGTTLASTPACAGKLSLFGRTEQLAMR